MKPSGNAGTGRDDGTNSVRGRCRFVTCSTGLRPSGAVCPGPPKLSPRRNPGPGRDPARSPRPPPPASSSRRSMAVFWIQRKASGSLRSEAAAAAHDFARSTSLARLQPFGKVGDLSPRAGASSANRLSAISTAGTKSALVERLDQVGHRAGVPCPLDQLPLAERGQDHDGRDALGSAIALVRPRSRPDRGILHVEHDQVRVGAARRGRRRSPRRRPDPTTSYPSSASISARSRRISASSSAITTRRTAVRSWLTCRRHSRPWYRGQAYPDSLSRALGPGIPIRQRTRSQTPCSVGSSPTRGTPLGCT